MIFKGFIFKRSEPFPSVQNNDPNLKPDNAMMGLIAFMTVHVAQHMEPILVLRKLVEKTVKLTT